MGLQLVVLAKVNSIFSSHNLTPLLAGLIWPFLAKLSFSSRLVRETYTDLVRASGLFFFRLRQIDLEADQQPSTAAGTSSGNGGTGGSRWERALLLVYRGMARTRRSMTTTAVEDEDSLHALSMLAL